MTYSKSLQGYFVSGFYTPIVLLVASLVVWLVSLFLISSKEQVILGVEVNTFTSVLLSFLFYVRSSFLLNGFNLLERRARWLPPLFLWLTAIYGAVLYDVKAALGTLLLTVTLYLLMECQLSTLKERSLYSVFAVSGLSSLLLPEFLFLVPLYVIFLFISNIFNVKRFLAALLGFITPFWLFFGCAYVWPSLAWLSTSFKATAAGVFTLGSFGFTTLDVVVLLSMLLVMLPAIVMFLTSSVPSKPILRHRMSFLVLLNVYILILAVVPFGVGRLAYAWLLPGITVMSTYILSFKATKLSNCYFILLNIVWVALYSYSLWTQ